MGLGTLRRRHAASEAPALERPAKGGKKAEWQEYAASLGLDAEGLSRDAIVALVEEHEAAQAEQGTEATGEPQGTAENSPAGPEATATEESTSEAPGAEADAPKE